MGPFTSPFLPAYSVLGKVKHFVHVCFCSYIVGSEPPRFVDVALTGKYISKANARRSELKILNMQKASDLASSQNTSYSWKKLLEDYPNHDEAAAIRKRIIRLEVDEISGDKETGQIPTFNQYGSSY